MPPNQKCVLYGLNLLTAQSKNQVPKGSRGNSENKCRFWQNIAVSFFAKKKNTSWQPKCLAISQSPAPHHVDTITSYVIKYSLQFDASFSALCLLLSDLNFSKSCHLFHIQSIYIFEFSCLMTANPRKVQGFPGCVLFWTVRFECSELVRFGCQQERCYKT